MIKNEIETRLANRRVGDIRDKGKAKSEDYPEAEISTDNLNNILKAIKDPSLDEMDFTIN